MRLAAPMISLLALASALAGCQALAPAPDLATLPHATVAGTHVDVNGDRVDSFRVLEIDGRSVLPITDQPMKLIGHDATNLVAAGHGVRVDVEAFAAYNNTMRSMFWDPMRAHGIVEFVPAAGARYVVNGSVSPEVSSVWIENAETHQVVGRTISVPGRAASAADAASAPAQ